MALPSLPDRKPMFDGSGFPTVPTRVWWQSAQRAFGVLDAEIGVLEAAVGAAAPPFARRTLSASGAALATDYLILVDATAGAVTVTLPVATASDGAILVVKKFDVSANAVTIDANAAETIDGALTQTLAAQYDTLTLACDGGQWWLI